MLDDTHKNGDELTAIFVTILKTAKQPSFCLFTS